MAKKREVAAPESMEGAAIDLTEVYDDEALNPALEQLYAEIGVDAKDKVTVYISKVLPDTGRDAQVWKGSPDDYDLSATAKRFGSGEYRIKVYAPTERGNPGIRANQVIMMLLDPADDARIKQLREGAPVAGMPATQQPLDMAALLKGLTEGLAVAVASAVKAAQPPVVDTFAQFERMSAAMKNLMPAASSNNDLRSVISTAKDLIELSNGIAGGRDGGETSPMHRGLNLFERLLQKKLDEPNAPQPQGRNTMAQPQDTMTPEQKMQARRILMAIQMANDAAVANVPPEKFAEENYHLVPDDVLDLMAGEPQWFDLIVQNVPEAAQHKAWYEAVKVKLIAMAMADGFFNEETGNVVTLTGGADSDTNSVHGAADAGTSIAGSTGTGPGR